MQAFIRKRGLAPIFNLALGLAFLTFVLLYGERLNPWDGKTWSDFEVTQESARA